MIGIIWVLVIPRGPLLLQEIILRGIEFDWPHSVMKQPVPEHGRFDIVAKQIGIRLGRLRVCRFRPSSPKVRRAVHLPGSERRILGEIFLDTVPSFDIAFVLINPRLKLLRVFARQHGSLGGKPMLERIKPRPVSFLFFLHAYFDHRIRFHKSPCRHQ